MAPEPTSGQKVAVLVVATAIGLAAAVGGYYTTSVLTDSEMTIVTFTVGNTGTETAGNVGTNTLDETTPTATPTDTATDIATVTDRTKPLTKGVLDLPIDRVMSTTAQGSDGPLSEKQQRILEYLKANADEQTYFKSRLIGEELGLSSKEVGTNMLAVAEVAHGIEVEKWGYSSSTTWMVET